MTQIALQASLLQATIDSDEFCGQETSPTNPGWNAVIDGIKGGVGDPAELTRKMVAKRIAKPSDPDRVASSGLWDLESCGPQKFPMQAHHLVPEKLLPKEPVCVWLTDSPKDKHDKYELTSDTYYDTNAGENGRFMPFASTTHQWKLAGTNATKQQAVCARMMELTGRQLHQGPHSSTDYGEDLDAESAGYKKSVRALLEIVERGVSNHYDTCEHCKGKKKNGKIPVPPLPATVKYMYMVSEILEILIIANSIWVSRRAYRYAVDTGAVS